MISIITFFVGVIVGYQLCKIHNTNPVDNTTASKVEIKIGPITKRGE